VEKLTLNIHKNHTYILFMENNKLSPAYKVLLVTGFVALITLFFTACSSTPKPCQELDWYEIGRQDGSRGLADNSRRTIGVACPASDESMAEALYNNGFDAGASQYCTRANGFELGRTNTIVADICPPLLKEFFAKGYAQGKRFNDLQKQKSELDRRIEALDDALEDKSIEIVKRGLASGEKIELEARARSIATEIESLEEQQSQHQ
jgi:Protein of unknown function (DUF2799)